MYQFVCILAIAGEHTDSNAGIYMYFSPISLYSVLEKVVQFPHDNCDMPRIINHIDQNNEFVPAQTRYGVDFPHR